MKKVLVAYSASSTHVSTTLQYLLALKQFTDYDVHFVHCTHGARINFDFNDFDVLFHNYCARLCVDGYLSHDYERAVMSFRGLKIAAVQDDYDRTLTLHRSLRRLGFHILFTSIQSEFWPLVYPPMQVPGLSIRHGLTGYVPSLDPRYVKPLRDRSITIGYRGRELSAKYGKLGFEKYEIGVRIAELCERLGLRHDIATNEKSRIYGDAWFDFIGNCRAMLGSESGSNAFDFDGVIERRCAEFEAQHGRPAQYGDISDFLAPFERPFDVGQISPRVFECAIMRTPMVLFRGSYSGIMEADVHYITLEKDFSNAEVILSRLDNLEYLEGFAERAHRDLIASGKYTYKVLADAISEAIEKKYPDVVASPLHKHLSQMIANSEHAESKLEERPTDFPQTVDEFNLKYNALQKIAARPKLIRTLWHVVPLPIRHKLGPMIVNSLR